MPRCGSQIVLCDTPIRFDTYEGCSHCCSYCFVKRKNTLAVGDGESVARLKKFVGGGRSLETAWADWNIPLHWGGMSDPFQPVEKQRKRSLECLEVFAESQYPFVVSTKSDLIASEPYLSLIKQCNCVVQFSMISSRLDEYEKGASPFLKRVAAAEKISPYKRVIARVQPYLPALRGEVIKSIGIFHKAGVYGATFEAMKYTKKVPGTIKLNGDFVYPSDILETDYKMMKHLLHERGMHFYAAENRLRSMGDDLCCCGIEGLGWRVNTYNFNHLLFDKEKPEATEAMKTKGTARPFASICQDAGSATIMGRLSMQEAMDIALNSNYVRCMKK